MSSRNLLGARFAVAVGFVLVVSWGGPAVRADVIAHWSFDAQAGGVYPDQTGNHNATVVTNGTGAITSATGVRRLRPAVASDRDQPRAEDHDHHEGRRPHDQQVRRADR